jgi:hypothetical protein
MQHRINCVICLKKIDEEPLYLLKNFPFLYVPKLREDSVDNDIFFNLNLYGCNNCGCVQLKNLIDPKILYEIPHNLTYNTPIWKEHHKLFSEFICKNNENCSIIEVGGYSGVLANSIKKINNKISYKILDLCDVDPNIENVKFIQGNCENYTFNKNETVVLSHVFEHLYTPHSFIKNLKTNNVQNVYLSIPNMLDQIAFKRIPIVHQEHTFFCSFDNIKYLFGFYGYKCIESYFYINQSIFFYFGLSSITIPKEINFFENSSHITTNLIDAYKYNEDIISNLNILDSFYISPAGLYGQILYHFLKDVCKNKCLGFLDNDPSKNGKRLYGIPKNHGNIYKMDEIKNKENLLIILYNGPYAEEIKNQLLDINSTLKITKV